MCKARVSPAGETRERFKIAVIAANETKKLSSGVHWKALQYRYKRSQAIFRDEDKTNFAMSRSGGELYETEEILADMKEDREELLAERKVKREREKKMRWRRRDFEQLSVHE